MATIQSLPEPPDELEQEAMLRTLRRLVVALEVRARSAAIRLNDEWKELVAEHTRKVVAQGNSPLPEEYRGIHYGLALALIDRLKPYYEEIAFKKKGALRKTRGIDNALESALLILLSEDCDFDEVAWGFDALGPWGSAFVERSQEYCEKYGWPSLPDHRAMIRLFGTSGFFSGTGSWEVRYALVWKMAQRVINTLESAAAMSTNSAANVIAAGAHVRETLTAAEPAPETNAAVPAIGAAEISGPVVALPRTTALDGQGVQLKREVDYHVAILEALKDLVAEDSTRYIARRNVVAAVKARGYLCKDGTRQSRWASVRQLLTKAGVDRCMEQVTDTGETKKPLRLLPAKESALVRHLERARRAAADATAE
jgi:hypothetical protein